MVVNEEKRESADKLGSVKDGHSSRRIVTHTLKQPTRIQREPRQRMPIWSCFKWGLPCRSCCQLRGALLPHLFTLTCLGFAPQTSAVQLSVALSVSLRCLGVT